MVEEQSKATAEDEPSSAYIQPRQVAEKFDDVVFRRHMNDHGVDSASQQSNNYMDDLQFKPHPLAADARKNGTSSAQDF